MELSLRLVNCIIKLCLHSASAAQENIIITSLIIQRMTFEKWVTGSSSFITSECILQSDMVELVDNLIRSLRSYHGQRN